MITTMGQHQNYFPQCTMDNDPQSFYWTSRNASKGDTFTVRFDRLEPIKDVHLVTGKPGHPNQDCLHEGVVEVQLDGDTEDQWQVFARVVQGQMDRKDGVGLDKAVRALRVRVTQDQPEWLAIQDIQLS
jgi:hypothetical protein